LNAAIAGKRVTAVGGGTGLSSVLRGLKSLVGPEGVDRLVGVVTMTDEGGSSGRLRREFGMLPPGDIRNCLAALADDEDLLTRLFQYRFANGDGLSGHSFGNLFLAALTGITGDFYQAVLTAEQILSVRGRILPATLEHVRLRGHGLSGRVYQGEVAVSRSGERLEKLELVPPEPAAFAVAVAALEEADLILLGPGSLYTSIMPNLLIPGIREAMIRSVAPVVLFLNLMTEPGETDAMGGVEHLEAIEREVGPGIVDVVVTNGRSPSIDQLEVYAEQGARPVLATAADFEGHGVRVLERDMLVEGDLIRHDPPAIRRVVEEILDNYGARCRDD